MLVCGLLAPGFLACALLFCDGAAHTGHAAEAASVVTSHSTERPRIGLSLGGGGARGLAHIGVLRVLEEERIPVDVLAGTSMGAIVGSLFALGLTADEIEAIVRTIDWEDIFTDHVDRQRRSFRRKQDDQAYLWGFEFGLSHTGPVLPHSIARGQALAFALPVPELHTAGHRSFDDLPIPFRAVATDVESGEPVILDHGNLFRAVRASMTVPLAFPPVSMDGRHLVDGGLSINNPVQVVRDMGADVVLAISVDPLPEDRKREELDSVKEYIYQLLAIALKPQVQSELSRAEVVVRVPLDGIAMDDFTRYQEAIAAGVAAARAAMPQLAKYAVSPQEYEQWRQSTRRRPTQEWRFHDVQIRNQSRVADAYLQHNLQPLTQEPADLEALRSSLERIYDTGILEPLRFDIDEAQGQSRLTVTATEKSYAPRVLHFGVEGRTTLRGNTEFSILARMTRLEIDAWGAEVRSQLALGTDSGLESEFYQPLGVDRHLFLSVRGFIGETRQDIYEGGTRTGVQLFRQSSGGVDLGVPLGTIGELRSGLLWGRVSSRIDTGTSPLDTFKGGQGSWDTKLRYDLLDAPDFPRSGGHGRIVTRVSHAKLGARDEFQKALATWTEYRSAARATMFWSLAAGSSFNSGLPPQEQFLLGGFSSFAGYSPEEFRGDVLGTVRIGSYVALNTPADFIAATWYAGLWGDVGNVWQSSGAVAFETLRTGGAAFLGADTIIGPAFLTGGWASGGEFNAYVTLGMQVGLSQ